MTKTLRSCVARQVGFRYWDFEHCFGFRISAQRHQSPIYFAIISNLQPGHARPRALVCARDTAGIQKQNVPASFISRHMRMAVQEKIGRAHSELQSPMYLVCRLLLEKKK